MDEKGSFWLESLLSLSAIVLIFGTLLPLGTQVTTKLQSRKLAMYAAETAYYGSIHYRSLKVKEGQKEIDGKTFEWVVGSQSICVTYLEGGDERKKCVEY